MTTHGSKTSTSTLPSNPARGPIRGEREVNRRRMKAPRPTITPATAYKVRLWYADIERARGRKKVAKGISKGADRYLRLLKGLPTVQAGGFADIKDSTMARWLGCSRATVLRHRHEAVAAGLLEDKGTGGRDHKPCLVRPILSDGSPVFTCNSATLCVAEVVHEQASLSDLPVDSPPTPNLLPEEKVEAPPESISFNEVWESSDKAGPQSYAETEFSKLSDADKVAIAAILKRDGRLQTGTSWVGKWLKFKRWPTLSVPITKEEVGFRVHSDKPNGGAWQRYWAKHGLQSLPFGRDGYFIRRLPTEWPPER